jgi:hypothetical protein
MEIERKFDISGEISDFGKEIDDFVDDLFVAVRELNLDVSVDINYEFGQVDGEIDVDKSVLSVTLRRKELPDGETTKE